MSVIGNIQVEQLNFEHGEKFVRHCLTKGNRPTTANKIMSHLHSIFAWAVRRRQIERNPLQGLRQLRITDRPVWAFSNDEVSLLVKAAPSLLWQARILIARCAGLRVGEILNLTWPDIDLDDGIMTIRPKEDTETTWAWHPKDYEIRELPLSTETVQLLAQIRAECPATQPYALLQSATYVM